MVANVEDDKFVLDEEEIEQVGVETEKIEQDATEQAWVETEEVEQDQIEQVEEVEQDEIEHDETEKLEAVVLKHTDKVEKVDHTEKESSKIEQDVKTELIEKIEIELIQIETAALKIEQLDSEDLYCQEEVMMMTEQVLILEVLKMIEQHAVEMTENNSLCQ